jgi:hypothetical protein
MRIWLGCAGHACRGSRVCAWRAPTGAPTEKRLYGTALPRVVECLCAAHEELLDGSVRPGSRVVDVAELHRQDAPVRFPLRDVFFEADLPLPKARTNIFSEAWR